MPIRYFTKNIRKLLNKGFSVEELRDFCFDTPEFKPVYNEFASNTGKAEVIRRLLEFAEQRGLFEILLNWAKEHNPAKFEEYQPYSERETAVSPPSPDPIILDKGLSILVVDDEDIKAEPLKTLLELYGLQVDKETNPYQVRTRVQSKKYALVFLDLMMPNFDYNGLDVLVDIKTFSPSSKVIVMTSNAPREQPVEAIQLGASGFIDRHSSMSAEVYVDKMKKVMEQKPIHDERVLKEALIENLWRRIHYERSEFRGQNLQGVTKLIIESIDGFDHIDIKSGASEEVDIYFDNHRTDALWRDQGGVIYIGCRNWSGKKVDQGEYNLFYTKLMRMRGTTRLGFLISYSGFSDELRQPDVTSTTGEPLIVLIDYADLQKLVGSKDREETLRGFVRRAIHDI